MGSLYNNRSFLSSRKGEILKIHIDLPWGGTFELEHQPMDREKFYALCGVAGAGLFVVLLLGSIR